MNEPIQPYGDFISYDPDMDLGVPPMTTRDIDRIHRLLVDQMRGVLDNPVLQYCHSSIWNQRIWDYLIDTAKIHIRPT